MLIADQPRLVAVGAEGPELRGTRCTACNRLTFPPLLLGCDVCGATTDRLREELLRPAGSVVSSAVVHVHHNDLPTPFTVVDVELDAGPVVRAMGLPDGGGFDVGQRVAAAWQTVRTDAEGNDFVEPVFRVVT